MIDHTEASFTFSHDQCTYLADFFYRHWPTRKYLHTQLGLNTLESKSEFIITLDTLYAKYCPLTYELSATGIISYMIIHLEAALARFDRHRASEAKMYKELHEKITTLWQIYTIMKTEISPVVKVKKPREKKRMIEKKRKLRKANQ